MSKVGWPKEKDELVIMDDIVDITSAELGVEVPPDAGVVIVFSWGWRKGLFYDFGLWIRSLQLVRLIDL